MSNQIKQIRGQIRQIVKELLPEMMSEALLSEIKKQLSEDMADKFKILDERNKATIHYLLKQGSNRPKLGE